MPDRIMPLIKKHREPLAYIVFGALTTAVNQISFEVFRRLMPGISSVAPTVIAWVISVIFAYATNRRWVFHSKAKGGFALCREAASFFGARTFSLLIDAAIMWVVVDIMRYNATLTKLASNVLVIILNYIFSKFWVFRRT